MNKLDININNVKTYLGKRGYILTKKFLTEKELDKIRKDLTVVPSINEEFSGPPEPFKVFSENDNKLYIPRFYGIAKFGQPVLVRMPDGEPISVKFTGIPRENQLEPISATLKVLKTPGRGGGILHMGCGGGKTSMSLYIVADLGTKTLVVVHKEFLLNQWKERIAQFLPTARIGLIQQNVVDIENKDIVIAMLQSLSMKEYALDTFDSFGLVILDECHRIPCQVFSQALKKINSRYMLGLSATPIRKDGLTKVLKWYIGDMTYSQKVKVNDIVCVERMIIHSNNEIYKKEELDYRGRVKMPTMINNITQNLNRTRLAVHWMLDKLAEGRKILALSDRRNHLDDIFKLVNETRPNITGYYVGGMKEDNLKKSEGKDIILGTFSMACLSDRTLLQDATTGEYFPMSDFANVWGRNGRPRRTSLWSYNENGQKFEISAVGRFGYTEPKPCVEIRHALGNLIVSTDHRIFAGETDQPGRWKPAGELRAGHDKLLSRNGWVDIREICPINMANHPEIRLCDIEMPQNHNFLASGILVHNSEGLDIPGLDTLFLLSPKSDIIQSVGRILRKKHAERYPLVVDFVDKFSLFENQAITRQRLYKTRKYAIEDISVWDETPYPKIISRIHRKTIAEAVAEAEADADESPEGRDKAKAKAKAKSDAKTKDQPMQFSFSTYMFDG